MARVILVPEAARALDDLPLPIHHRVLRLLDRLERWPSVSGAKPMRGVLAGRYRLRTGDYRLLFRVEGHQVVVEKLGHRGRFYED